MVSVDRYNRAEWIFRKDLSEHQRNINDNSER